jgi:hypothetical protein
MALASCADFWTFRHQPVGFRIRINDRCQFHATTVSVFARGATPHILDAKVTLLLHFSRGALSVPVVGDDRVFVFVGGGATA